VPFNLIALAIALAALSGVPGLFMPRASPRGQRIATILLCLGAAAGIAAAGFGLFRPEGDWYVLPWQATGGSFVGIDALSAFFLFPVFLVGGLGSVFGLGYWPQSGNPRTARKLQFFWGTLVAGMALLVVSKHAFAFLLGWEFMALSAFFLVSTEDGKGESRKNGVIYIIATHVCTLTLFGFFALWRRITGSFDLTPIQAGMASLPAVNALFFLAFIAFGMKAGMMPLHFWLPGAHANAPSHVSAMLSGVMLKMGIYGLMRMLFLLPEPPAVWGWLILFSGAASGLLGVVFALAQHDLKRLLAYHSVENIGIILIGLGLAMLGRTYSRFDWIALGMAGCLLHVWNHALFKSLLFFGAGSVLHGARARDIDILGGLSKRMPWTAAFFLIGAVAICGLPPLNGFISEFFVYLGLFRAFVLPGRGGSIAILAAPVLAMIGALAVACFVKVYGTVFLGEARTPLASRARESPASMIAPMAVLAALCLFIGVAPVLLVPILERATAAWLPGAPAPGLAALAPVSALSYASLSLSAACAFLAAFMALKPLKAARKAGTWDCGYAKPDARMQYTASSFAHTIVGFFFWILKPKTHGPLVKGNFPHPTSMESHVDEVVLDRTLVPGFRALRKGFGWFRRFQQGQTQYYIFFVLAALFVLLVTLVPFRELLGRIFSK
jgi:hydrogenase-4 component B